MQSESQALDGIKITYVADNQHHVNELQLQSAHEKALRYLLTLFPAAPDGADADERLLVVWLGADPDSHRIGGIAGGRSFVANYLYGGVADKDKRALQQTMGLTVLAHEQFHQFTAMRLQTDNLPVWANESLAHYYGLKALTHSGLPNNAIAQARSRFIDHERPVETGLLTLAKRYQTGDQSVYPLFYSQGATFWSALDEALNSATNKETSLDDFIVAILQSRFDETGMFDETSQQHLHDKLDSNFDELLKIYLR